MTARHGTTQHTPRFGYTVRYANVRPPVARILFSTLVRCGVTLVCMGACICANCQNFGRGRGNYNISPSLQLHLWLLQVAAQAPSGDTSATPSHTCNTFETLFESISRRDCYMLRHSASPLVPCYCPSFLSLVIGAVNFLSESCRTNSPKQPR